MLLYLAHKALQRVYHVRADIAAGEHQHYVVAQLKAALVQPPIWFMQRPARLRLSAESSPCHAGFASIAALIVSSIPS